MITRTGKFPKILGLDSELDRLANQTNADISSVYKALLNYGMKSTATSFTVVTDIDFVASKKKTRLITILADGSITVGTESGWV